MASQFVYPFSVIWTHFHLFYSGYQLGVELKQNMDRKRQTRRRFGYYFDSKEAYVAAELSKDDVIRDPSFVIGDGQFYGQYYNAPLTENRTFVLYVAFLVRLNSTVRSTFNAYLNSMVRIKIEWI